ncbi:hypothetical protein GL50803_004046 [Giardia duodenalis]|uniref:Uncharacterized protein n=1 Tax=Giardia intestinalis (strain ATCC 50803 / WB clone C6) TaxID=184922 RepID=A8BMA7_GIAIC|nr:hypothetical protein GL50803_004046 [Giardia intestinalis]KAE8303981.1 hypothetical protein GL50803_004046 [Giardia intestinalis]|eukprot:XP_001706059.1 Hypothetical protein GL50803_4046 [Giardia lamblia ATCC 50803]
MYRYDFPQTDVQRCEPMLIMLSEEEVGLLSKKGAQGKLTNIRLVMNDRGYARIEVKAETRLEVTAEEGTVSSRSVFLNAEPVKQPPILVVSQQSPPGGQKAFECNTCVKRLHLTGDAGMVLE